MKVIKDKNGNVINIGEWDYMIEDKVEKLDPPSDVALTEKELDQYKLKTVQVIKNPIPEGAYEADAKVAIGEDGGLYVVAE